MSSSILNYEEVPLQKASTRAERPVWRQIKLANVVSDLDNYNVFRAHSVRPRPWRGILAAQLCPEVADDLMLELLGREPLIERSLDLRVASPENVGIESEMWVGRGRLRGKIKRMVPEREADHRRDVQYEHYRLPTVAPIPELSQDPRYGEEAESRSRRA